MSPFLADTLQQIIGCSILITFYMDFLLVFSYLALIDELFFKKP